MCAVLGRYQLVGENQCSLNGWQVAGSWVKSVGKKVLHQKPPSFCFGCFQVAMVTFSLSAHTYYYFSGSTA